jgi:hypothetical protein
VNYQARKQILANSEFSLNGFNAVMVIAVIINVINLISRVTKLLVSKKLAKSHIRF